MKQAMLKCDITMRNKDNKRERLKTIVTIINW